MAPANALFLFVVVWLLTFLVAIPFRIETQDDSGDVVPGTHGGSPARHHLKKKAWITTLVALVIWGVLVWVIVAKT